MMVFPIDYNVNAGESSDEVFYLMCDVYGVILLAYMACWVVFTVYECVLVGMEVRGLLGEYGRLEEIGREVKESTDG